MKYRLVSEKTYRKIYWYIWSGGDCVAGPFDTKGEAVNWMREA